MISNNFWTYLMTGLLVPCFFCCQVKKQAQNQTQLTHRDSVERGLNRIPLIQQSQISLQHYMPRATYDGNWRLLIQDLAEARRKNKEVMQEASQSNDPQAHLLGVDMTQVMSAYNKKITEELEKLNAEDRAKFFKSLDSLNRLP
ncbi:MAG: hypothetical protein NZ519_03640 [Bacteroidia bacterium]|nr:hypothetical protein [Bacteroidia bacterium]MDW8302524.1 hypothetical protein [Bacteroidia bacterium]